MQYTIRNVPKYLGAALRRAAHEQRKSRNDVVLEALTRGVALGEPANRKRDLRDIAGAWREDPAFDAARADQDTIDASQIEDILQRVDAMPTLEHRSPDQIVGYEEDGLPN